MSNVSQIYGTLRDSEPYIILNSTQTEVSGNLAVLQNLDVCGNITFNNTDLSTALSNLVVDLTGGQDASFTNVDISGILDAGTNGTIKAANFNVGSKNVIDGSAGVSCRALEVKNQSNYICLMAQDSQVTISGSLILNNTDVSGKLTQIDASLVDLASNGGGGGTSIDANNNIISNTIGTGNPSGSNNIFLGQNAGNANNNIDTSGNIFIGNDAGKNKTNTDNNNIIIGTNAMSNNTNLNNNIVIGRDAALTTESLINDGLIIGHQAGGFKFPYTVVIGNNADEGNNRQNSGVCIGHMAGNNSWSTESVVIGANANKNCTPNNYLKNNVIIGLEAAEQRNTIGSVAIGYQSQKSTIVIAHTDYNTSVGYRSMFNNTSSSRTTAIGNEAGYSNSGNESTYLGSKAAYDGGNFNNTTVINSTGIDLNPTQSNAFFVKPIRDAASSTGDKLLYDSGTGEITYQADSGGGSTTIAARQSYKFVTTLSINTDYVIGYLSGSDYCETQFEYPSGFVTSLASNGQNITSSGGENRGGYFKIPSSGVYNINGIVHFNLYIEGVNIILWYKRGSANGVKIAENYKQNNNSTHEQSVSLTITSLFDANIDDLIYMTIGNPNSSATNLSRTIPQGGDSVGIYFEIHKI